MQFSILAYMALYNIKILIAMLVVSAIIISTVLGVCLSGSSPTVTTPLGKIKGHYRVSHAKAKYEAYESIPYALPPIEDRRFQPPEPIQPWSEELLANKFPKHCIGYQRTPDESGNYVEGVEDCLYLNVYVPLRKNNETLPVIIWFYGGAFQYSTLESGAEKFLVDHNVIVVTLNYRHGVLGFLSTEDNIVTGNMGLKDQAIAIKWVSKYIEYFGGDSKKITLTGLSAGGASVHYHYLSPMTAGLFQSGISFSGTAFDCWPQAKNSREKALRLGQLMNCPTNDTRQMIQCLKDRPAYSLVNAQSEFMPWNLNEFTPFGPVVENLSDTPFIDRSPIEIVSSGDAHNIPWITGVVREEGLYPIGDYLNNATVFRDLNKNWESIAPHLLQYYYTIPKEEHANVARKIRKHYFGDKPFNRENVKILIHMVGDRIFIVDAEKAARVQAQANRGPVWFYYYTYKAATSLSNAMTNSTENFGLKDAELYYVREGIINTYAMNFVVPVAASIDDLEFTWQSLAGRPLAYSMKLDYEDMRGVPGYSSGMMALLPPKVNVSSRGFVPVNQQVFAIRLPCSGLESAEIMLSLKLNVTAPPESKYADTVLVFKRNKICIKGIRTQSKNDTVWLEPGPLTNGNGAFYVAATCACALIFVVVSVASTLYIRNSKARSQHPRKSLTCCSYSAAGTAGLAASSVLVKVDNRPGSANSGSYATIADLESLYARPCGSRASYYAASHVTHLSQSTDPCEKARAVAVPRIALKCRSVVQEGTFGRVYRGSLIQAGREQEVIIKTVTEVASAYQASLLVVEGSQLAGLVHGNIASLAASCLEGTCPMLAYSCALSELNLKTYLTGGQHHPVTRDLVNVAVQVARAGAFLHGRGILHRDIAARNCLIDTRTLRTRLADAALSRDLFPQDYHCLGDNENRAIGWMALEALQHGQYSTASDAWSFGVFLWELATLGQQPYHEVDPFELTAFLRDGYRLSQPRPCPDELFAVMAVCWLGPTRDRPTMPQLLAYLQEFYDALGGFI